MPPVDSSADEFALFAIATCGSAMVSVVDTGVSVCVCDNAFQYDTVAALVSDVPD